MPRPLLIGLIGLTGIVLTCCLAIAATDLYYRRSMGIPIIGSRGDSSSSVTNGEPVDVGEAVYNQRCSVCHGIDSSSGVGPPLGGLYGSEVPMEDGSTVTADEDYIHESIVDPSAKVREGYPDAMPSFGDRLSEEEIDGLVEFIKSLE